MFVYNNLIHDARVRKEARTLTEAGYDVTVLAVHDPGRTPREERVQGFRIVRLSRSILGVSRREIMARLRDRPVAAPSPQARSTRPGPPRRPTVRARLLSLVETTVRLSVYPLRRVLVYLRFVRAALRTRAGVYHAHDLNTLLMAWTGSRLGRGRLVYDSHEVATDRANMKLRWWARFLEGRLIHAADAVVCTNRTRADYTQQLYGLAPPVILRNLPAYNEPEPSGLLHERLGLPAGAKVVLYQGGIQAGRGLEQLMEAAPAIPGALIVLLGSGRFKPAFERRVAERGMGGKLFFHDAVPVDELPQWTMCAYLGLQILQNTCFNHYSSLSNKLLEYLMAGVPVVASDLPEMRRVIEETGAGVLVDASDPAAIAEAVNRLLADEALREEMAQRARQARGRYCWEREEQVLVDLYARLLGPRAVPPSGATEA
jgi:glycosyltransferase involved in cell wall biosynthesis